MLPFLHNLQLTSNINIATFPPQNTLFEIMKGFDAVECTLDELVIWSGDPCLWISFDYFAFWFDSTKCASPCIPRSSNRSISLMLSLPRLQHNRKLTTLGARLWAKRQHLSQHDTLYKISCARHASFDSVIRLDSSWPRTCPQPLRTGIIRVGFGTWCSRSLSTAMIDAGTMSM